MHVQQYQLCCLKYIRKCILSTKTSPQLIAVIIVIQNIYALHDFDPFLFLFIFARLIVTLARPCQTQIISNSFRWIIDKKSVASEAVLVLLPSPIDQMRQNSPEMFCGDKN